MLLYTATWKNMFHFLLLGLNYEIVLQESPSFTFWGFDKLVIDMTLLLWVINLGRLVCVIVIGILKASGLGFYNY